MDDLTRRPKTEPNLILRQRDAIYAPELFAVALVELDLFSWLAKSPANLATICSSLRVAERPADVMMTLFCAMGLVEKQGDRSELTENAREFLVRESPWFLGPYFTHFRERAVYQGLFQTLRTDKPTGFAANKLGKPWAESMLDDTFAEEFTGTMDCRGMYAGPALAAGLDLKEHRRLLDIGGGSGIYACCIAAAHPHIHAAVLDRPPVDRVTRKSVAKRGFSGRVDVVAEDMFARPLPTGYDVHLFSNALHDWAAPGVSTLVEKSFAALPPGGMIVVHDRHLNRDKTGPLPIAAHSVFLMAGTEGRYYSIGEIESFLAGAGFGAMTYRETVADYSVITGRKPGA
jgi:SAM-dependent methyltransferase